MKKQDKELEKLIDKLINLIDKLFEKFTKGDLEWQNKKQSKN